MARTVLLKGNVYAKSRRNLVKSIFHPVGLGLGKSVGISNLQKRTPEIVKTRYIYKTTSAEVLHEADAMTELDISP